MAAQLLNAPTATFNQPESAILLTSGSTVRIKAPAKAVFEAILDTKNYETWNTWSPKLDFPNGRIDEVESTGILQVTMSGQNRTYAVPVKILDITSSPDRYALSWRGQMLPEWFGISERVQSVIPISEDECELRQWESMSGWGIYLLKYLLGVQKSLDEGNIIFANDLKAHAEKSNEI
jgi:hypothetical protein